MSATISSFKKFDICVNSEAIKLYGDDIGQWTVRRLTD